MFFNIPVLWIFAEYKLSFGYTTPIDVYKNVLLLTSNPISHHIGRMHCYVDANGFFKGCLKLKSEQNSLYHGYFIYSFRKYSRKITVTNSE